MTTSETIQDIIKEGIIFTGDAEIDETSDLFIMHGTVNKQDINDYIVFFLYINREGLIISFNLEYFGLKTLDITNYEILQFAINSGEQMGFHIANDNLDK